MASRTFKILHLVTFNLNLTRLPASRYAQRTHSAEHLTQARPTTSMRCHQEPRHQDDVKHEVMPIKASLLRISSAMDKSAMMAADATTPAMIVWHPENSWAVMWLNPAEELPIGRVGENESSNGRYRRFGSSTVANWALSCGAVL
jgi:hypothetical protein